MSAGVSADAIRVLVIDDDRHRARVFERVLRMAGYDVTLAHCAADGLTQVKTSAPQIIVLDVMLPDRSGIEVCHILKSDPATRHIVIVLLSSQATASERQAVGLEAGANGYIAWPISRRELLARVALAAQQAAPVTAQRSTNPLSRRQCEIVVLIAQGLTSRQIAKRLGITLRTAETHRAAIMQRLDLHTTAELVRFAVQHGLLE